MARSGEDNAQNNESQYNGYATSALNNFNSQQQAASNDISSLEGSNPYTSKSYLTNQNIQTSAAMNANDNAGKQQLQDTALRTGTNTAALQRTIASNARAGQRTMDQYNANQSNQNEDKYLALQQGLIGDRATLAGQDANVYGTSSGASNTANGQLIQAQENDENMWGNIISGAAGAAGSVFSGKG